MRTSQLRMGALAGAVILALGGCSTTSWSDMTSRSSGGSTGTGSATQASTSGSSSAMSGTYGSASSGASTTPRSAPTPATAAPASSDTIAQNSTSGRETDTISGSSARSYADAPSTLPKDRSSTTSSASTGTQSTTQGAELDTLTGRSARRGYAQNQALNAQTPSSSTTGTRNVANAGPTGAMGAASKSMSSAARASTRDRDIVGAVQQALNDKGFNPGPIDGKWGPRTQAALTKFQKSEGITASRKLDDQTLAALGVDTSNMRTSQAGSGADSSPRVSSNSSGRMQAQKH